MTAPRDAAASGPTWGAAVLQMRPAPTDARLTGPSAIAGNAGRSAATARRTKRVRAARVTATTRPTIRKGARTARVVTREAAAIREPEVTRGEAAAQEAAVTREAAAIPAPAART